MILKRDGFAANRYDRRQYKRGEQGLMTDDALNQDMTAAITYLEERGVQASAREFRLRQEFFRHQWDMRVREGDSGWVVRAVKPDRPNVEAKAATESDALRLALAQAIGFDESAS
jgi:hypothetical protein